MLAQVYVIKIKIIISIRDVLQLLQQLEFNRPSEQTELMALITVLEKQGKEALLPVSPAASLMSHKGRKEKLHTGITKQGVSAARG